MHRKTREVPAGQIVAGFLLFILAVTLLVGVSWLGSPAASASTGGHGRTAVSHTRLWWDGYTCKAFWAFERKPSPERFRSMVRASGHADTYLRSDMGLWNADVRRNASAVVLETDRGYVALDCTWNGD